jgi:hypothetical protein
MPLTAEQNIAQQLADAMWAVATSENHSIAWGRGDVYAPLDKALHAAIKIAYGIGDTRARKIRYLLSELGPDDTCQGTSGRGIASYAEYVKTHRGARF